MQDFLHGSYQPTSNGSVWARVFPANSDELDNHVTTDVVLYSQHREGRGVANRLLGGRGGVLLIDCWDRSGVVSGS